MSIGGPRVRWQREHQRKISSDHRVQRKKGLMANNKMFISQIALNPPAMMVGCVNETNLAKMPEFSIFRLLL